jgi:hypothetical protein
MQYATLPSPVSASEALKAADINVDVPNGASEKLGPFEGKWAQAFRVAEIKSFRDLQQLGFVHRELREEHAVQAIRADERAFREASLPSVSRAQRARPSQGCSCAEVSREAAFVAPTRKRFQNNLIDVLESVVGGVLRVDHPLVSHSYYHVRTWLERGGRYAVGVIALQDITIGQNATLTVTPAVSGLYARDITLGDQGRLSLTGGGIKVRCREVTGPPSMFVHYAVAGVAKEFARRMP